MSELAAWMAPEKLETVVNYLKCRVKGRISIEDSKKEREREIKMFRKVGMVEKIYM